MTTASLFDLPGDPPSQGVGAEPVVTFLHTADWQLGMTRHFLSTEAAHAYAAARQEAIVAIGELATERCAEFVVVAGDVFEDHRVSARMIRRTLDCLADFPVPVYLLPGNHDPFDAAGIYRSATFIDACPPNVVVLATPGPVRVREGVEIVAAPWFHKAPGGDLVADALRAHPRPADDPDTIRIVVGHGGVDRLTPGGQTTIAVDPLERALDAGAIDYVALGDRHSVTSVGASGRIWYAGAHEVTNFDHIEEKPGHVLEVTLRRGADREVAVTPHAVGRWSFRRVEAHLGGADDIEALRAELEQIRDKTRVALRLRLIGTLGVTDHAALETMLGDFADRFASVSRDNADDLVTVADASDVADLGLSGYAADAAAQLVDLAGSADPEAARTARDALGLLRRLAGRPA